jgi:hypothetical protein
MGRNEEMIAKINTKISRVIKDELLSIPGD